MPELELLPEKTKRIEFKRRKPFRPVFLVLLAVLILYGGLIFYNRNLQSRIETLDADFTAFNEQRNRTQEARIFEVKEKLNLAQSLLDNHILWSEGFKKVQALTLASVKFESLAASFPESRFEFRATAPNLSAIARQGANFLSDDSFKDMSINQIKVLTSGRTEFVINLTFDKSKFLK